jgi:hypothetical protein
MRKCKFCKSADLEIAEGYTNRGDYLAVYCNECQGTYDVFKNYIRNYHTPTRDLVDLVPKNTQG